MAKQKVLIVGGGFAGVKAALELCGNERFSITLLSDRPDFQYHPSLFRTVTGGAPAESSIPLKKIFGAKTINISLGNATHLDRKSRVIRTEQNDNYEYDLLILALGTVTNYFGIEGLEQYSYGMKSMAEVRKLKEHIHQQFSDDNTPDPNYVIVGGGPTGIELAGALPSYLRHVMQKHGIKNRPLHIDLVEAAPNLVPRLPFDVGQAIAKRLRKLGIRLYLGKTVQGETADTLMVDNKTLNTHTVIWTAGMTNHPFFIANNFALTDKGKVVVDKYLQAEPDIFVLGDNADTKFSGMAQTALHDSSFVTNNIKLAQANKPLNAYKPREPVYITPVGSHWAAIYWRKIRLYGWIGSFLRSGANWIAYHDLEPWWQASKEWLTEFEKEEDCPTCVAKNN